MYRNLFLVFFFMSFAGISFSQKRAVVLQNVWNNDLNPYNPQEFFDELFSVLKERLSVKDFTSEPASLKTFHKDDDWNENLVEMVKAKNAKPDSVYYIAVANELRLPALNLGKLLFKKPPRSSKLTFTFHIYDGSGKEVLGDTIINRGCSVKTIDEQKGSGYFYSDYESFMDDMKCHLAVIRRILREKQLPPRKEVAKS